MSNWVSIDMIFEISEICKLISENKFHKLVERGNLDAKSSVGIKRNILEYLCGDVLDERDLKRIGVPNDDYVKNNIGVYDVDPRSPSDDQKRIKIELIVDGVESDLSLIMYAYKQEGGDLILIYDALTL